LKLQDSVHFAGFLENLNPAYAAMDAFAFPAQAEGLGSALLIAMSYGLPVVATARGGISEVVEHGSNGLLIAAADAAELAAALLQVLRDSEQSQRMGHRARETVERRFSVDRMVDATLELYRSLVAGNAPQ
jgi:glycosyltransferase involved in cell wall biosynthesis